MSESVSLHLSAAERVAAIFSTLAAARRSLSVSVVVKRSAGAAPMTEPQARHHLRLLEGNGFVRRVGDHAREEWELTELSGRCAAEALSRFSRPD